MKVLLLNEFALRGVEVDCGGVFVGGEIARW